MSEHLEREMAEDFLVWAYGKTDVCTREICEWYGSLSLEDVQRSVAKFIEDEIRELYADFSEWFNLAEYPDVLELFNPSEKVVFLRAAGAPDDMTDPDLGNYDCFLGLVGAIPYRIAQASLEALQQAAELFNWTVEMGLFLCHNDAGATVHLGHPADVAPFLLNRIANRIPKSVPSGRGPTEFEQKFTPILPILPILKEAFELEQSGERILALNLLYWICGLYHKVTENDV